MNLKIGDIVKIKFDHVEKFMKNWAPEYEEAFNIPMERMKIIFSDRFTVTNTDIDNVTKQERYILKIMY